MNKTEIIASLAKNSSLNHSQVAEIVDGFLTIVKNSVNAGNDVRIGDFGTFRRKNRPERMGINPATKEPLLQAERNYASFKPSKNFIKK